MKLKLEKQKITSLSSSEMKQINGGGEARSDRRNGNCAYSRRVGTIIDDCGGVEGCKNSAVLVGTT